MRGQGEGLHAAGVFVAVLADLGEQNAQGHALARADALDREVQLQDAAQGLQAHVARVKDRKVVAALDREVHRHGAGLLHNRSAVHLHRGRGEGHDIALVVGIG